MTNRRLLMVAAGLLLAACATSVGPVDGGPPPATCTFDMSTDACLDAPGCLPAQACTPTDNPTLARSGCIDPTACDSDADCPAPYRCQYVALDSCGEGVVGCLPECVVLPLCLPAGAVVTP